MERLIELLTRIDLRLACIEKILAKPPVADALTKGAYSCNELSELSQIYGVKKYRPFTIRLACKDGRIPEATKQECGSWSVPRQAVMRILEEGMPPERRNGDADRSEMHSLDRTGS